MSEKEFDLELDELETEKDGIDIHAIISLVRANWKIALFSSIIALLLAFIYVRYATPIFETKAKILIKDEGKSGKGDLDMLQALGIFSGTSNVNNELEIIQSYSLMDQVVRLLNLNISLYSTSHIVKAREIYINSLPFGIRQEFTNRRLYDAELSGKEFILTFNNDSVRFQHPDNTDIVYTAPVGDKIELPGLTLHLLPKPGVEVMDEPVCQLVFHSLQGSINRYTKAIEASIANKQVSVIDLSVQNSIPQRAEDLLNTLVHQYIRNGIDDRNAVSDSTISFIDVRLANVETDLTNLEGRIQVFKQQNEIVDISQQAGAMIGNASGLSQSETNLEVQLSVVNSLIDFLQQTDQDPKVIAASLTVSNPGLNSLIDRYNSLLLERERNLLSVTMDNPLIVNLDAQLSTIRNNIRNGLNSQKQSTLASLSTIRSKTGSIESNMRTVPGKERQTIEFSRQQQIKSELYLFLLQKREEAALTKSSTISNVRIIDTARTTGAVKPRKGIIFFGAFLFGLLLPFGWILLFNALNLNIRKRNDITSLTDTPIVGEIGHFDKEDESGFVIKTGSVSSIAEQFRILRTNLRFILNGNDRSVIMLTSSIPSEGKTFVALNLAASIALTGKRTLLMGMDLRKPQIAQRLGLTVKKGISDVLIGAATIDEVTSRVPEFEHLSVMVSGTIPPNPAELLLTPATKQLFADLKQRYDCIVVDNAPMVVTDASILSEYADTMLLVVRMEHSYKESLKQIEKLRTEKRFPNLGLVVNDIVPENNGYSYYGYGYGYGYSGRYGYGYYSDKDEPSKKRRSKGVWKKVCNYFKL